MGFCGWIIFGALAGWVASLIMGRNRQMGCLANVIVGIAGAFLGGLVSSLLLGGRGILGFDLSSFIIAVIGAVALLALTGWYRARS